MPRIIAMHWQGGSVPGRCPIPIGKYRGRVISIACSGPRRNSALTDHRAPHVRIHAGQCVQGREYRGMPAHASIHTNSRAPQ